MGIAFFSFEDIRRAADCREIAQTLYGVTIKNGRCAATWRGGTNPESVSIDREKWFDHGVGKNGGGAIELAMPKFGNIQQAQQWLGEHLNLTPKTRTGPAPASGKKPRYDTLIESGYTEVARYFYRDLAGEVRHVTIRLQHPNKPGKEFVQGAPKPDGSVRWGLSHVETILYRLPEIAGSDWVAICEGEKSADRLAAIGLPTTTAPMGAGKWQDSYAEALRGKHVAIFPDNDAPGREHAATVAAALHGKAASVRIIPPQSEREKGGIDDWIDEGGGHDADDVLALVANAPDWAPSKNAVASLDDITQAMLTDAKSANSAPFRNYIPHKVEVQKRGKAVEEVKKDPRNHQDMLNDMWRRFLGFPRKVGDSIIFDHDRDSGRIFEIRTSNSLMAWIGRKSKQPVDWTRGEACITQDQYFESAVAEATRYESISLIPSWPKRSDVYYAHGPIPPACPNHSRFNTLLDMFLPASPEDKCLLSAMICCPLWFVPGIPRPAWIIDSRDGQGSGKTTLVELIAYIYGRAPISTFKNELVNHMDVVRKRCLGRSGRHSRVFLVDNATGDFHCDELASMMTARDITGMAPYGHGEETRPNDLTYVITANSATVSTDIADRSLYIFVLKPPESLSEPDSWKSRIQEYIDEHRLEIVADMIDMLETHFPFPGISLRTRFREFERDILQPCCGSPQMTVAVLEHVYGARDESNAEYDQARAIADTFEHELSTLGIDDQTPVFIRSEVVNSWGRRAINDADGPTVRGQPIQLIRNLAKIGFLPHVDKDMKRLERDGKRERHTGIGWKTKTARDENKSIMLVLKEGDGIIRVRAT